MAEDCGVGVIGFGLASRVFHCPFISAVPGLTLKSIVQRKGSEAASSYPDAKIVRSVEELLSDSSVGLVVVATPNETHYSFAKQALEAGKHVVVDKPFAGSSSQAHELTELASRVGRVLAPFHNRRWDGDFLTVSKLIRSGDLGRLVTMESHFDRFRPMPRVGTWREAEGSDNGLLLDIGPHLVDQAFALFGPPDTVTASVRMDRDGTKIEDAFDIALGYERFIFWCRSTMLACDASPRFLLHGTSGSFKKFGLDLQEPSLLAGAKVPKIGTGEWLAEPEERWGYLTVAPVPAEPSNLVKTHVPTELGDYRQFYANVKNAILGTDKLAISPEQGIGVIRVLELARQSSQEKRSLNF